MSESKKERRILYKNAEFGKSLKNGAQGAVIYRALLDGPSAAQQDSRKTRFFTHI